MSVDTNNYQTLQILSSTIHRPMNEMKLDERAKHCSEREPIAKVDWLFSIRGCYLHTIYYRAVHSQNELEDESL